MTRDPLRRRARHAATLLAVVLLAASPAGATTAGAASPPAGVAATPAGAAAAPAAAAVSAVGCPVASSGVLYRAPVAGPLVVLRGFDHLDSPYAAGHRGVDLQVGADAAVRAAAEGVVSFAGPVAGRGVVVVAHADGIRTSYEPVAPSVVVGASVAAGTPIGRVVGAHGAFPPDTVLHWGARRGETYLDPLDLLHPLAPVRLLPWDDP